MPLRQIRAAFLYQEPLSQLIQGLKYNQSFGIAAALAEQMVQQMPAWDIPLDFVLPLPLHPDRHKKRGYNQAALLADRLTQMVNLPYEPTILARIRDTQPQVGLTLKERRQNMEDAFQADAGKAAGKNLLLIDDVYTTGATLSAAAAALLDAGAESVSGYCLAGAMPQTHNK